MIDDQPSPFEGFLLKYGIDIGFLVSGFFGSLLLVSKNSTQRLKTTIASILAGMACANYLTPVALGLIPEAVRPNSKYAMAFVLGFLGLKGLEYLIDRYFTSKTSEDSVQPKKPSRPSRPKKPQSSLAAKHPAKPRKPSR